jgi:integrase-like protein
MRSKQMRPDGDKFIALIRWFTSDANPKWRLPQSDGGYAASTKELWERELNYMAKFLGDVPINEMRPSLVQAYFDGIADRPGKQQSGLAVLRQLEKRCIVRDVLPRQITLGVEIGRPDGGHIPWSSAQVALGEQHLPPHLSRAITLGANTGQRGSDLVRMGPTDIEVFDGIDGINVLQQKSKRRVWVPITSELAAAMRTWERRPGPFLLRADGRPWTRKAFYSAFVYACETTPALAPLLELVPHGLRGHACVRLRRAGATIPQIADMVGMSEEMVARYCRFSIQKENAVAAIHHLERTLSERKTSKSSISPTG